MFPTHHVSCTEWKGLLSCKVAISRFTLFVPGTPRDELEGPIILAHSIVTLIATVSVAQVTHLGLTSGQPYTVEQWPPNVEGVDDFIAVLLSLRLEQHRRTGINNFWKVPSPGLENFTVRHLRGASVRR